MKDHRKVEVIPYNHNWVMLFKNEAEAIQVILGSYLCNIYHIGSTAIPGMPAKPVIDIMLECNNLDDIRVITEKLNTLKYYDIRRHVIPHRSFFTRRQDEDISYHLHIRERGDPQIKRHVIFRDYVIHHPEDAKAYAALKRKLANQFADNINNYVFGKDKLVQEIDSKAKLWKERKQDFLSPHTGNAVHAWSHEKIIKAMEANLNVYMTHFAQYVNQIKLIRIPGYTSVNTGLKNDAFNCVLEADFTQQEASDKIQNVIQQFIATNIPFTWWVSPYDKPEDLTERLLHAGLVNDENVVGMYLDLDEWQSKTIDAKLEIIKVTDKKGWLDFANVTVNDMPASAASEQYYLWVENISTSDDPIECYVGYVDGKPVIRGQVVYFAQVAGFYEMVSSSHEVNKEYDHTMRRFLLQRAKEAGFHVAVLHASEKALSVYEGEGFKSCCVFKKYKVAMLHEQEQARK